MSQEATKTFPDIMSGKKIMYVHGFCSSAQSGTVAQLRQLLPNAEVVADDIPLHPEEAVCMLKEMAKREEPDLIIGTSMGGMYAEMLTGYDRILVNPAFQMGTTMGEHGMMGKQTFFNPRKDGQQEFIVTKALQKEYQAITEQCFATPDPEHVWGMFGDRDPLVHTRDLFLQHYPRAINFHGEHRLNEHILTSYVIPLIRKIDNKQRKVSLPVVLIDIDSMKNAYGQPASSVMKAYYQLICHYEVYLLAPSPSTNTNTYAETMHWVEQYVNAPAHDSVIFCNQTPLLMADYLITRNKDIEFMGTIVPLGSPEVKTWEDIITYFERLGGQ